MSESLLSRSRKPPIKSSSGTSLLSSSSPTKEAGSGKGSAPQTLITPSFTDPPDDEDPKLRKKSSKRKNRTRPKSSDRRSIGDFACIRSASELPCFSKSQASTPSDDGSCDLVETKKPLRADSQDSTSTTSSSRGFLTRLLSLKNRSRSRDRHKKRPSGSSALETQCLLSSGSVTESLGHIEDRSPREEKVPQTYRSVSTESAVSTSVRSISPGVVNLRPCPTPPLAIFSSDEDISSLPHTPRRQKALSTVMVDDKPVSMVIPVETPSPRMISPQLEKQISQVFMAPRFSLYTEEDEETVEVDTEHDKIRILPSYNSTDSPSTLTINKDPEPPRDGTASLTHTPSKVKRRPKYSRRKHYTIDFGSLSPECLSEISKIPKRPPVSRQTSLSSLLCTASRANTSPPDDDDDISDVLPHDFIPPRRMIHHPDEYEGQRSKSASRARSTSRTRISPSVESDVIPNVQQQPPQRKRSEPNLRKKSEPNLRYCRTVSQQTQQQLNSQRTRHHTCPRLSKSYSNVTEPPTIDHSSSYSRLYSTYKNYSKRSSTDLARSSRVLSRQRPVDDARGPFGSDARGPFGSDAHRVPSVDADQVPLLSSAEVASNDSGIQQDEATPTSIESLKFQLESAPLLSPLRQQSAPRSTDSFAPPRSTDSSVAQRSTDSQRAPRRPRRDRPKSDCLTVRWADSLDSSMSAAHGAPSRGSVLAPPGASSVSALTPDGVVRRPGARSAGRIDRRERPKSDVVGSFHGISESLQTLMRRDRFNSSSSSLLTPEGGVGDSRLSLRSRRMSTPQPIRVRAVHSISGGRPATTTTRAAMTVSHRPLGRRVRSAPDLTETDGGRRHSGHHRAGRRHRDMFRMSTSTAGDLALQPHDFSSDEDHNSDSEDSVGYGATTSVTGSMVSLRQQQTLEEIFEDPPSLTYAEALWDHVTMDTEELGFRASDVITVVDRADRDWWYGRIGDGQGWFPAAFVRLRANQIEYITSEADDSLTSGGQRGVTTRLTLTPAEVSVTQIQGRTNVVREILHAEREYVRHLSDVIQGYVEKCHKRPEMFPATTMAAIFGNLGDIFTFSRAFLAELERHVTHSDLSQSNLGRVFIKHSRGFEIYSEYCNNHPTACDELRNLTRTKKYTHFFEACRLLQDMIELPLEGFLLMPVQKICKYPLQLKELLKYTPVDHPDHTALTGALETMRRIAVMINERKRKMESLEKLWEWQRAIEDWTGPDLLDASSELIYSGEMTKVNNNGWHQERVFFLFDHQLIYCKKDMLWRDMLIYKGRIDLDNCLIKALPDEKDPVFNVQVKHGLRIYDSAKSKWYLVYCRSGADRARWFRAFQQERHRVEEDGANGFDLAAFRAKVAVGGGSHRGKGKTPNPSARYRERTQKHKKHRSNHRPAPTTTTSTKHPTNNNNNNKDNNRGSDKTNKTSGTTTTTETHRHHAPNTPGGSTAALPRTSTPIQQKTGSMESLEREGGHSKRWFSFGNKKTKR